MSRKLSEIGAPEKIWIIELIESKKSKFRDRVPWNQGWSADNFDNAISFLLIQQVRNIDALVKDITLLINTNPNVEVSDSIESLWKDVLNKYTPLYDTIYAFNESWPGVNDILNSNEWQNFHKNIQSQFHEYDSYSRNYSSKFEKIKDLETRTYTLFSLIQSTIIEAKWNKKEVKIPKEIESSKEIAQYLIQNKDNLESAIQSAKSINTFKINNIDEALRNVWEMFYNKDAYLSFINSDWSFSKIWTWIKESFLHIIFMMLNEFLGSPRWWLLWWLTSLSIMLWILWSEYFMILDWKKENLQTYKDFWQLIVSIHIIWASFLWYITVFSFSQYKKLEYRHEAYRFRWILTRSFWFLLKTADEEQQKILYPKALDAIFKDLPETNTWQDVNINLPVSEILKWVSGK